MCIYIHDFVRVFCAMVLLGANCVAFAEDIVRRHNWEEAKISRFQFTWDNQLVLSCSIGGKKDSGHYLALVSPSFDGASILYAGEDRPGRLVNGSLSNFMAMGFISAVDSLPYWLVFDRTSSPRTVTWEKIRLNQRPMLACPAHASLFYHGSVGRRHVEYGRLESGGENTVLRVETSQSRSPDLAVKPFEGSGQHIVVVESLLGSRQRRCALRLVRLPTLEVITETVIAGHVYCVPSLNNKQMWIYRYNEHGSPEFAELTIQNDGGIETLKLGAFSSNFPEIEDFVLGGDTLYWAKSGSREIRYASMVSVLESGTGVFSPLPVPWENKWSFEVSPDGRYVISFPVGDAVATDRFYVHKGLERFREVRLHQLQH